MGMIDAAPIRERFSALVLHLNERERRLLAATEAHAAGYGAIAAVMEATGIAASTIGRGLKDLAGEAALAPGRVQRSGGGRKPLVASEPTTPSASNIQSEIAMKAARRVVASYSSLTSSTPKP